MERMRNDKRASCPKEQYNRVKGYSNNRFYKIKGTIRLIERKIYWKGRAYTS